MLVSFIELVLAAAFAAPGIATLEGPDPATRELRQLQGRWEEDLIDEKDETVGRVEKQIAGKRETLTVYDRNDRIEYAHWVEFELDVTDKVRIFRYGDVHVTAGPEAGQTLEESGAYIYRIDGDHFFEIHGALKGDVARPFDLHVWRRVTAADDQARAREQR